MAKTKYNSRSKSGARRTARRTASRTARRTASRTARRTASRTARRTASRTAHTGRTRNARNMLGGTKSVSPFLGYGWTGQVSSWPGTLNKSSSTCSGIMQSNYYPLSKVGITQGIPIASNTLRGGWRKNSARRRPRRKSKNARRPSRSENTRQKSTSKNYTGGGRTTILPDSAVNLWHAFKSIPKKLSNTWEGYNQPASLDPYPYNQPIDNVPKLHMNVGYKLNPAQLQNRAPNSAFNN